MPVSISTVKSPEASEAEGRRPLRSWMSLRLARSSSSSSVQAVADAEVALGKGQAHAAIGERIAGDGELRAADLLPAEQVADRLDGRRAGSRGWVRSAVSWFAPLQAPHVFQPVLLEDGGEVGLGHVVGEGAVAEDDVRLAGRGQFLVPGDDAERQRLHLLAAILAARQTSSVPAPMLWTVLPAMVFCFDGHASGRGRA